MIDGATRREDDKVVIAQSENGTVEGGSIVQGSCLDHGHVDGACLARKQGGCETWCIDRRGSEDDACVT